jgi:hypothetical protein
MAPAVGIASLTAFVHVSQPVVGAVAGPSRLLHLTNRHNLDIIA